jgi:hypothetical protein
MAAIETDRCEKRDDPAMPAGNSLRLAAWAGMPVPLPLGTWASEGVTPFPWENAVSMTSLRHPQRFGRVQILASALFCGGIVSISLPWLLSAIASPETPTPFVLADGQDDLRPQVALPTKDLQGKAALECDLMLLKEGLRLLEQTENYSGTFKKQERVNGILDEGSIIQVKGRHQPMSLYLKWLKGDVGRELLWVEGERDGEMLVRLGGIRGRLLPALKLNPDGETAREKARHHISSVSVLNLTKKVVAHSEKDQTLISGIESELIASLPSEAGDYIRVTTKYASPDIGGEYRKTIHHIDRKTLLPVRILTYGWPDEGQDIPAESLDTETLLEDYGYSDLQFNHAFTAMDFSEQNPAYCFRKGR